METLLAKYKTQLANLKSYTYFTSDTEASYHEGQISQLESTIEDLEAELAKECA